MFSKRIPVLLVVAATTAWACAGDEMPAADEERDLSLAPAESIATIADEPVVEPEPVVAPPAPRPQRPPPRPPAPAPAPAPAPPAVPTLGEGTMFTVYATDTLTSRHNEVGQDIMAIVAEDITNESGEVVVPAGAVFHGTISDLAPAESPGGEGRMVLTFSLVEFQGEMYGVQAVTDAMGSRMSGRGVTAGDAAKVGAGAVVGAIAGRIIGGNRTGTAVGAAAGAAAGVGIAAATRDVDIVLDAGAPIVLVLTAPLELDPIGT